MHLFSHRPLAQAKALTEADRPQEALRIIDTFIAAKQARLPSKRCSRLQEALVWRDCIIKPRCAPAAAAGSPEAVARAVGAHRTRSTVVDDASSMSSYARVSQDSLVARPLTPDLASAPRVIRHMPPSSACVRPRVRPPSMVVAQPRPTSGLSDLSVLSDTSLDRAVLNEATVAHLRPVVYQTMHFVPSHTQLALPR